MKTDSNIKDKVTTRVDGEPAEYRPKRRTCWRLGQSGGRRAWRSRHFRTADSEDSAHALGIHATYTLKGKEPLMALNLKEYPRLIL